MSRNDKIRELELEIARLKGVIEGMKASKNTVVYQPTPITTTPAIQWPYRPYDVWCGSGAVGYAQHADTASLIQN